MTTKEWKVMEKGKKHTAEIIEAEDGREAKKAYRAKNNLDIKLSALDARIMLKFSQEHADEVYDKMTRKPGWSE